VLESTHVIAGSMRLPLLSRGHEAARRGTDLARAEEARCAPTRVGALTRTRFAKLRACSRRARGERHSRSLPLVSPRQSARSPAPASRAEGWRLPRPVGGACTTADPAISTATRSFIRPLRPERDEHRKHPRAFIPQGGGRSLPRARLLDVITLELPGLALRGLNLGAAARTMTYDWKTIPHEPRGGCRCASARVDTHRDEKVRLFRARRT